MFHGETALRKIFKFLGETANFSDKFQGEIQVFPGENEGFSGDIFHYFSQKKRQLVMEKTKKCFFFFTCTVFKVGAVTTCSGNAFHGEITLDEKRFLGFLSYKMFSSI